MFDVQGVVGPVRGGLAVRRTPREAGSRLVGRRCASASPTRPGRGNRPTEREGLNHRKRAAGKTLSLHSGLIAISTAEPATKRWYDNLDASPGKARLEVGGRPWRSS